MNIVIGLLTVVLVVVCLLMVLIVMMQRPKQEGLGAAFGGGMTDQMFGAQTTNVLQKGTVYLAVMFFGITLLLSVLVARKQNRTAALGSNLADQKEPAAAESPAAADTGTGVQLLSETPLAPDTTTPSTTDGTTPATTESATPPATEGDAAPSTPVEIEATPTEPSPSIIDSAAPLPDDSTAPETPVEESAAAEVETPGTETPAEKADDAGETPNP